jgi:hypothetical protein
MVRLEVRARSQAALLPTGVLKPMGATESQIAAIEASTTVIIVTGLASPSNAVSSLGGS